MALAEDAATVLEDWVQTVANLPAEIQHVLEEIQAKDRLAQDHRSKIANHDVGLQKHIKTNGCAQLNPKEDAACKTVSSLYDKTQVLQDEKVSLSERAATLLDRQIKRLDIKIRDLQNDGSIQPDPQLPSLLTNNALHRMQPLSAGSTGVTTPSTTIASVAGSTANIANAPIHRVVQTQNTRQPSPLNTAAAIQAHNVTAVRQNGRSPSVENPKRRRLNTVQNLPATSSNLRQTSLGPGTPKTGLDGQARGSSTGPRPSNKKVTVGRSSAVPQRVSHLNPISTNKKPGPAARRRARQKSGTPASTKDDASGNGSEDAEADEDVEMVEADQENEGEEVDEDEEGDGDDRKYCTCRSVSYGNMVACDNNDCPYEWFHWSCVGITSEPKGKWYCPECRPNKGRG